MFSGRELTQISSVRDRQRLEMLFFSLHAKGPSIFTDGGGRGGGGGGGGG